MSLARDIAIGAVCMTLLGSRSVIEAQNRGQYIPGVGGLNAGIQAPLGFSYINLYSRYEADKLKGPNGHDVPVSSRYVLDVDQNLFAFTTPWKLLGATYGAALDLVFARGQLTFERFDASAAGSGFSDMYVEPMNLGWALNGSNLKVAYGFVAPVGDEAVTSDYWGHDVTLAATFYLDPQKLRQVSINSVTEFHQTKRDTDLRVGNNTNLEFAAGQIIPLNGGSQLMQLAVVGYAQWQLTNDAGADAIPALARLKDRVFALGPEIDVIIPKAKLSFVARYEPELAARNRAQGYVVTAGLVKSF